jgi:hypothetical protein
MGDGGLPGSPKVLSSKAELNHVSPTQKLVLNAPPAPLPVISMLLGTALDQKSEAQAVAWLHHLLLYGLEPIASISELQFPYL